MFKDMIDQAGLGKDTSILTDGVTVLARTILSSGCGHTGVLPRSMSSSMNCSTQMAAKLTCMCVSLCECIPWVVACCAQET